MAKRKRKAAGAESRHLEMPRTEIEEAPAELGERLPLNDPLDFYPDEATGLPGGLADGGVHVGRPVEEAQGVVDGQWILGYWSGLERWECLACQWDTLDGLEEAREHKRTCPRCGPGAVASGGVGLGRDGGGGGRAGTADHENGRNLPGHARGGRGGGRRVAGRDGPPARRLMGLCSRW